MTPQQLGAQQLDGLLAFFLSLPGAERIIQDAEQRIEQRLTARLESKNTEFERAKLITATQAGKLAKRCPLTITALRKSGQLTGHRTDGAGRWLYNTGEVMDWAARFNPVGGPAKRAPRRNKKAA